jgi:hypothetical protein
MPDAPPAKTWQVKVSTTGACTTAICLSFLQEVLAVAPGTRVSDDVYDRAKETCYLVFVNEEDARRVYASTLKHAKFSLTLPGFRCSPHVPGDVNPITMTIGCKHCMHDMWKVTVLP